MNSSSAKTKTLIALQFMLWTVCAFHVFIGAGLNVSDRFVDMGANMYGAKPEQWDPQFLYIVRPLGVFMLALGVLAGAAALNPSRYRVTIYVFAGIFVIRALQRILFGQEISELYGIEGSRNVMNMIFFFALAAVLIVLDQLAHRGGGVGGPATAHTAG